MTHCLVFVFFMTRVYLLFGANLIILYIDLLFHIIILVSFLLFLRWLSQCTYCHDWITLWTLYTNWYTSIFWCIDYPFTISYLSLIILVCLHSFSRSKNMGTMSPDFCLKSWPAMTTVRKMREIFNILWNFLCFGITRC